MIKYLLVLICSFFISFELLSSFYVNSNQLLIEENKISLPTTTSPEENVYLIGDSFAKTDYVNEGYPILFNKYFESKGLNFIDLSINGSELNVHRRLLDSLSNFNPKLIIYYYNLGDVISLEKPVPTLITPINKSNQITTSESKETNETLITLLKQTKSVALIKDAIQFLYLTFTDQPYPSSFYYKFPLLNKKHEKEIQKLFNSIKAKHVIIVITTPFNCGDKPKEWQQYTLFKEMELNKNITLIQSVDIINDPELGVSWRNGHPNQKAIKIVSDSIFHVYSNQN